MKIGHYAVEARGRKEERFDIQTPHEQNENFTTICYDHAGDNSEFAQCNFSETRKQASKQAYKQASEH